VKLTVLLDGDPVAPQQARLGAALARRGHRVLVLDAPEVARQIEREHGERCEERHIRRSGAGVLLRFRARRLVRRDAIDVVHLNYLAPRHEAWATLADEVPYVATAWGSDLNDEVFKKPPEHARAVAHVLRGAAAISADSVPLLRRALRDATPGVPAEQVLWGVDLASLDPARARELATGVRVALGIEPGRRVLLSPRQTRADYNVDRIVRAFARSAWARGGAALVVELHGRPADDEHRLALEALAQSLGVRELVRFAPRCADADLPAVYATADAAVSIPDADGVPSTYAELMALGVPIVANDLPAYEGVLAHDDRSLLVPRGDEDALVRALDRLLDEPGLAARLAARGQAWARDHADWERCVDRFVALYEAAIEGARARRA
jgi:glycosyltransferase involved in cell wall biosynthesis